MRRQLEYFVVAIALSIFQIVADFSIFYNLGVIRPTYFLTYSSWLARFALEAILPFVVMYVISRGISRTHMRSVLVATFAGCLVGGFINTVVSIVPESGFAALGLDFLDPSLRFYGVLGFFVMEAFSRVLLASVAGILFAYYKRTPETM